MVGVAFDYLTKHSLGKIIVTSLTLFSIAIALLGALTTNAVPSGVEAPYVHMPDNYLLNWNYLLGGSSSSFIFNTYLTNTLSAINYFYYIFFLIALFQLCIIWLPINKTRNS